MNNIPKRSDGNLRALLLCLCGVMTNLLLTSAAAGFDIHIKLDTVGTVAVSVMGGYLPGVLVAFATSLIKSMFAPSSVYYTVFNVLIAVFAAYLSRRGWMKKLSGIVGMTAVFVMIRGGLGSLIPWFINGVGFDGSAMADMISQTSAFSRLFSHIIAGIITDLADKTAVMILAVILIRLIPEKLYGFFGLSMWLQTPVSEEDLRSAEKNRVISLRSKAMTALSVSIASVAVIAIVICVQMYHKTNVTMHMELAQGTARMAASFVDGDKIDEYINSRGNAEGYAETKAYLENILKSSMEISYLYVFRMEEDGYRVVFDTDTDDMPAEETAGFVPYEESFLPYLSDIRAGRPVEPAITRDQNGYIMTAMEPIYDSDGVCTGYAIADVDMKQLITDEGSFLVEMISVFLGFFIVIVVFGIWLTQYHIIYPVRSLTKFANEFSDESAGQEELDDNIRRFRAIDIHTGDEIEKLYGALCRMTLRQTEQTRSIRRLSDETVRMQDALIVTMADMVESRDSDTGAHVQKTAAYVRIIAEGLKKKGYYAEKLTPKFITDIVRSAPLHDVGKINIPDSVLNKPGKLTEEEYEIMKTHTTAGKKIMEHAIGTTEGDSYLKEAKNMAAYHHERWDGKGYPEGLHGNMIPLAARIMAVADVFDALASPRVYKPAFPFEKAVSIIEEGKGTQFDPKCVEAFMDAIPEIKEVLRKYNQDS